VQIFVPRAEEGFDVGADINTFLHSGSFRILYPRARERTLTRSY
jgi:hypothetical protein